MWADNNPLREHDQELPYTRQKKMTKSGAAGYRSQYLSHAKRALYHLSYSPSHAGHAKRTNFIIAETAILQL